MKIGIVEDELIIATHLIRVLNEIGYTTTEPAISYSEAVAMLHTEKPDLVLVDIGITGLKDGIDVAGYIKDTCGYIPVIFLTANADAATIERAKKVAPAAYLVKPFTKEGLFSSIEIGLTNFKRPKADSADEPADDTLFIKEGANFSKVKTDDILFISSDHVYITILTANKKFLVRSSLQDYITRLNPKRFVRVHRSYVVNIQKIDKVNTDHILLNGQVIPISKTYRDELLASLRLS